MAKHVVLKKFGSIDNLELRDFDYGKLGENEVKIKVMASALNRDMITYINASNAYDKFDDKELLLRELLPKSEKMWIKIGLEKKLSRLEHLM